MDIPKPEWTRTSTPSPITDGEIHIWRIDLAAVGIATSELFDVLSADERERADRFHFENDRENFVVRRGILRSILSCYLCNEPARLEFTYNNYDRPVLDAGSSLNFNSSSSNGIGIVGLTLDTRIGIDIEFVDRLFPQMEIAEKYFSTDELLVMRDLRSDLQTSAFFNCWTKKEAYVKAVGEGMSHPLPKLTVLSGTPNTYSVNTTEDTRGWNVETFIPADNFIASIAYEGEARKVSYFHWDKVFGLD